MQLFLCIKRPNNRSAGCDLLAVVALNAYNQQIRNFVSDPKNKLIEGSAINTLISPTQAMHALAAVGAFLTAFYPGIGTCISWILVESSMEFRRFMQGVIFFGGAAALIYVAVSWALLQKPTKSLVFSLAFAVGTIPLAFIALTNRATGVISLSSQSWVYLTIACVFCGALINNLLAAAWLTLQKPEKRLEKAPPHAPFLSRATIVAMYLLTALGWFLLMAHWYRGPGHTDGSIHAAMGGNQTFLGLFFLATFVVILHYSAAWVPLLATPWLYLALLTTSRLIYLLAGALILWYLLQIMTFKKRSRPTIVRLYAFLTATTLAFIMLLLPLAHLSLPLPYRISSGSEQVRIELSARLARTLRGLPIANFDGLNSSLSESPCYKIAAIAASAPDDREQMWRAALREIRAEPSGSWPLTRYDHHAEHPHNLILEIGLVFGALAAALATVGIAALPIVIYQLNKSQSMLISAPAVVGLSFELMRSMVSGALNDAAGIAILMYFLSFLYLVECAAKNTLLSKCT
jgi:hypothetical protein